MVSIMITATEAQNNFGKYLGIVMNGDEVIITKNGKPAARIIPEQAVASTIAESLLGIVSSNKSNVREEELRGKYGYNHK